MSNVPKISAAILCLLMAVPASARERHVRENAQCGPANDVPSSTAPINGRCALGNATRVSGGNGNPWTWTCDGLNGGSNAVCSAPYQVAMVNGACGPANGVPTKSAPSSGLCSAGNATPVTGSVPWAWGCQGTNGGTTASCSAPVQTASTGGQDPGPSASLFNSPYYQCTANYYVAANGSDSANGSSGSPWLTLQHADSMNVGAGACINVAPGTYDGLTVTHGGNAATATGYVVYRCQTMDACTINGNGGQNGNGAVDFDHSHVSASSPNTVNYVQFDGVVLVGEPLASQGSYGVGFNVFNGTNGPEVASHHVWLLNSIVHGFSQSGAQTNDADFHYLIHNTFYGNANTTCDAQGSGISVAGEHPVPGYTPTADDQTNPNSLLGPTWQVGGSFFHVVVEWNVTYNNALTQCGTVSNPYDTDGNGIIFDTNAGFAGNVTNYTAPMLAAFNVTYNNGGGGVNVFGSSNVTVANNSCFNNYLDPAINGEARACIDDNGGSGSIFINNIAVAIPATVSSCQDSPPYTAWNAPILGAPQSGQAVDTFGNNLTDLIGASCADEVSVYNGDTYPVPPNLESTSTGWVNVGTTSVGTESTPPVGSNFALAPGSKAIGAGLAEPYLPPSSVDVGACASSLTTCP
jgi:hypothetical protein